MSHRGSKQSPFVGKRVPLVDNGVPILYKRYTSVSEVIANGNPPASDVPGPEAGKKKKEKKRKHAEEGAGDAAATPPPAVAEAAQPPNSSSKKAKHSGDEAINGGDATMTDTPTTEAASEAAAAAARKLIKKEKKEKRNRERKAKTPQPQQENQSGGAADDAANGAGNGVAETAAGNEGGGEGEGQEGAAKVQGNAEEAEKIRSVMGFAGLSSKAAPTFAFGFTVEEQKAAQETERKLEWIKLVDSAKDGYIPRRVYIGGMPYSWEEEQIQEYWEYCGEIESIDMMRFPDSGRFRGIAFISFKTEEACEAALAYDGEQCEKSTLKVMRCKASAARKILEQSSSASFPPTAGARGSGAPVGTSGRGEPQKTPGYNVAYVGNIAFESTLEELQELFREYGVTKIRMHTDQGTGKFKGYAHVHFADEDSLDRAMELDGHKLHSRKIKVSYGQPKKGE